MVYLPSQQDNLGYLRDIGFILISKLFGKKIICHLRGGYFKKWYDETSAFMKWLVRNIQPKVDAQIVLGENLRSLYSFVLPDNRIFVVPNGGNYVFPEKTKGDDLLRILYLGNLIRTKGIMDFVNSFSLIKTDRKIEFVIAGEAKEKDVFDEINRHISQNKIPPIKLICPVNEKEKLALLSNTDIFVFPTYYPFEGLPWVIIEALAAGLPVITTIHAAIPDTVNEGINGFFVPAQNPEIIAEKISYLLENDPIRIQMGIKSREMYLNKFTKDIMISKISEVFWKVYER